VQFYQKGPGELALFRHSVAPETAWFRRSVRVRPTSENPIRVDSSRLFFRVFLFTLNTFHEKTREFRRSVASFRKNRWTNRVRSGTRLDGQRAAKTSKKWVRLVATRFRKWVRFAVAKDHQSGCQRTRPEKSSKEIIASPGRIHSVKCVDYGNR
jgi:hypothetical protein